MSTIKNETVNETVGTNDDADDANRKFPVDMVQVNIHWKSGEEAKALLDMLGVTTDMEQRSIEADQRVDEARKLQANKQGMPQARPGRGDTGTQVFGKNGLTNVDVSTLIPALTAAGLKASVATHISQPQRERATGKVIPGKTKHVVRIVFEAGDDATEVDGLALRLEAFLRGMGAQFLHVWQNDFSDTVNLVGGFTTKPSQKLYFKNDEYIVSPIASAPSRVQYPAR